MGILRSAQPGDDGAKAPTSDAKGGVSQDKSGNINQHGGQDSRKN